CGAAILVFHRSVAVNLCVGCLDNVDDAICWFKKQLDGRLPIAAGIDTLLCWQTDRTFRSCDSYLRDVYPAVKLSVIAPNSLAGSMVVQGMALAIRLRQEWPKIQLNETHPKVFGLHSGVANTNSDLGRFVG
ncbi:MAG: hypothetical protein ACRD8O_15725, partial [Bryobacteraceae bacterium]